MVRVADVVAMMWCAHAHERVDKNLRARQLGQESYEHLLMLAEVIEVRWRLVVDKTHARTDEVRLPLNQVGRGG